MTKPWEEQDDTSLSKVIKKAKRRTLIRNTAISLVVTFVILIGGLLANAQLTNGISMRALQDEWTFKEISGPNQYEYGYDDERGLLSGKLALNTYKVVEGVPVVWGTKKLNYSIMSRFSMLSGNHSNISVPDPVMTKENYEYYRGFNSQNGQREMLFYVPEVNYNGKILNDLPALEEMDPDKRIELAVSFDTNYTHSEVLKMLPAGLTQVWYWVDTYDNKKRLEFITNESSPLQYAIPESAGDVYGYGIDWEYLTKPEPKQFIQSLEFGLEQKGKYYTEYQRIFNYLKKDKPAPDANDVQLMGVVVTGTAQELQRLEGQPYVRAAVLGAIVDIY